MAGQKFQGFVRRNLFDLSCVLILAAIIFQQERLRELHPRHYVTTLCGRVMSDTLITNSTLITWEEKPFVTTNGIEYRLTPKTNQLWSTWALKIWP
jgi:hypothetical protein